jgi:hypothetical protein
MPALRVCGLDGHLSGRYAYSCRYRAWEHRWDLRIDSKKNVSGERIVPLSLLLNFSPIEFTDTEVEAGVFPYGEDGELVLKQLRHRNWATHVCRRDGPEQIVAIPVTARAPKLGAATKKIRVKENPGLTASLIHNSMSPSPIFSSNFRSRSR